MKSSLNLNYVVFLVSLLCVISMILALVQGVEYIAFYLLLLASLMTLHLVIIWYILTSKKNKKFEQD